MRMNRFDWLDRHFRPRKRAKAKSTPTRRVAMPWRMVNPDGWEYRSKVKAMTKSEARAMFKGMVGALPPRTVVEEVA